MSTQLELFQWNLKGNIPDSPKLRQFELDWLSGLVTEITAQLVSPRTISDLKKSISELVTPSSLDQTIAEKVSLPQFKTLIREYAPDGLTEAFAMCSAIPRLNGDAQASVIRILLDEFGRGTRNKQHSELYRNLLAELGLPTEVGEYTDNNEESFAFVNLYHWLTKRAVKIDYYLGALAFSEMVIPGAFKPFLMACERMGVGAKGYFSEHIKIDVYHTKEAFSVLETLANKSELDFYSAYLGARLAKVVGDKALTAALKKSLSIEGAHAQAS